MGHSVTELEHTADTGIRVEADDLAGLFVGAAEGMFAVMYCPAAGGPGERRTFTVDLAEPAEALWSLLSDLLSHAEADEVAFAGFEAEVSDGRLDLVARAVPLKATETVGPPVKAVTWHGLAVEREEERWTATVVFDI